MNTFGFEIRQNQKYHDILIEHPSLNLHSENYTNDKFDAPRCYHNYRANLVVDSKDPSKKPDRVEPAALQINEQ